MRLPPKLVVNRNDASLHDRTHYEKEGHHAIRHYGKLPHDAQREVLLGYALWDVIVSVGAKGVNHRDESERRHRLTARNEAAYGMGHDVFVQYDANVASRDSLDGL